MSNLLVVFGATGNQGGSVINYVLNDAELSKQFRIRAVTRDPSSGSSKAIADKGVEVVQGDVDSASSVAAALKGAHTIFLATTTVYDAELRTREVRQGKTVADEAVKAGAKYIVFSSLENTAAFSAGRIKYMEHFDGKHDIEDYIRGLEPKGLKSAFFDPGCFMQNFQTQQAPQPLGDGTYGLFNFVDEKTEVPLIETVGDAGKYVGAALAHPDKYAGKVFYAATEIKSLKEIAETMSKVSGKNVKYVQIPREKMEGFMPEIMAKRICDMWLWMQEFGYYGPDTRERVKWTGEQARGKLTTFEEYLRENPLNLE